MERGMNKVVIIKKRTRLEEMVRKYNTVQQARFFVEHMGMDFDDFLLEDANYRLAIDAVKEAAEKLARVQLIDREYLPNMIFGENDVCVAVGQDGLVANSMKYLDGQPLIGINPDPARFDGILLPYEAGDAETVLKKVLAGRHGDREITMAEASTKDGQRLLAVNDLFIGCRSHASARYQIQWNGEAENQSSSGIIVSTGLGATGWYKSVIEQAKAIAAYFGCGQIPYEPIKWNERKLSFVVREPFPSVSTQAGIVFGCIEREESIRIVSNMPAGGVIFSDGMEEDRLEFHAGNEAVIGIAGKTGRLVYG
ncbi:MAG: sugar kinase [Lachnospiraceae bacterium]|nr:sugar kinase [Lachnospiraceae bacterium]